MRKRGKAMTIHNSILTSSMLTYTISTTPGKISFAARIRILRRYFFIGGNDLGMTVLPMGNNQV